MLPTATTRPSEVAEAIQQSRLPATPLLSAGGFVASRERSPKAVLGFGEVVAAPPGVGCGVQPRALQKTAHRLENGCGEFQTDRAVIWPQTRSRRCVRESSLRSRLPEGDQRVQGLDSDQGDRPAAWSDTPQHQGSGNHRSALRARCRRASAQVRDRGWVSGQPFPTGVAEASARLLPGHPRATNLFAPRDRGPSPGR